MSKSKLAKFAEMKNFSNVLQNFSHAQPALTDHNQKSRDLKGKWNSDFFYNVNPIVLELGCGKGDYTVQMASRYPDKNFIGIDLKGSRIWTGAKRALESGLSNAAFVRTRIEFLNYFFAEDEVSEVWITFPDPYSKRSKANKRLTSPFFLESYRQFCKSGAIIHLKTDDPALFRYSLEVANEPPCKVINAIEDIYANGTPSDELAIQTYYEKMHLEEGRTINYLKFKL